MLYVHVILFSVQENASVGMINSFDDEKGTLIIFPSREYV